LENKQIQYDNRGNGKKANWESDIRNKINKKKGRDDLDKLSNLMGITCRM